MRDELYAMRDADLSVAENTLRARHEASRYSRNDTSPHARAARAELDRWLRECRLIGEQRLSEAMTMLTAYPQAAPPFGDEEAGEWDMANDGEKWDGLS